MAEPILLTAEQFARGKSDLPDGGRWTELVVGRVRTFQPPDIDHGTFVFNLTKALAGYLHRTDTDKPGYACFELGLIVARGPDTVRYPSFSFFRDSGRFSNADMTITEDRPAWVVDVASTLDRRQEMKRRVEEYLDWGIELIWVADPAERHIEVFQPQKPQRRLEHEHSLDGSPVLSGFSVRISDLFAEPRWWRQ